MWWFAALHANLMLLCRRIEGRSGTERCSMPAAAPAGCLRACLAAAGSRPIGLDADRFACERAAVKSGRPVCVGSVNALPFADGVFAAIVSADVLCHEGVDESAALMQFHRVLCERGVLILNLPAYSWLMSGHDKAVANIRRYNRRRLVRLLESAGFRVLLATYWNTILFPVMVLTRKLLPCRRRQRRQAASAGDRGFVPRRDRDRTCLARRGRRLPFGGSLIAIAAKQSM